MIDPMIYYPNLIFGGIVLILLGMLTAITVYDELKTYWRGRK